MTQNWPQNQMRICHPCESELTKQLPPIVIGRPMKNNKYQNMKSKTLKTKILIVSIILSFFQFINAQENQVATFNSTYGWEIGDVSKNYNLFDQVEVSIEVKKSYSESKHQYIVYYRNLTGNKLTFGARLTDKYPSRTHFSVTLNPNEEKKSSEILAANVKEIYFLISKPRIVN